jgi:serine palmitoyltransferase
MDDVFDHDDPYADVREVLEELTARDKAAFVYNQHSAKEHQEPVIPSFAAFTTYLGYAVLIVCGHVRDILSRFFRRGRYLRGHRTSFACDDLNRYAPLLKSWENFYTRRLYHRIQDCFNRPIASNPGANILVLERVSRDGNKTMQLLGPLESLETISQKELYQKGPYFETTTEHAVARHCLNLGSYNYLGFADDWQETCRQDVMGSLQDLPVSASSSRTEFGTTSLHRQVEQTVSRFLGKEDALVLNMGFNTNATTIPALCSHGDLLISDQLNHTSIVNGARSSGAAIRTFRHNDTAHLDTILKEAIVMGQPRTRRPWGKIMVIVEGIYSMEGEYCDLRNVVKVAKKYGVYVYLDEAHSIGAMGMTGRGCCEYTGVDTADIDIMMGTFTKSFGGMGGYIAASRNVIAHLRNTCAGSAHHNSLSPVVCQQIITSFKVREYDCCFGLENVQTLRSQSSYVARLLWEKMARTSARRSFARCETIRITFACVSRRWDFMFWVTTIRQSCPSCYTIQLRLQRFLENVSSEVLQLWWWAFRPFLF